MTKHVGAAGYAQQLHKAGVSPTNAIWKLAKRFWRLQVFSIQEVIKIAYGEHFEQSRIEEIIRAHDLSEQGQWRPWLH